MRRVILCICILYLNLSFSQNSDLGSWNVLNIKQNFNSKFSAFTEAQLRSLNFYTNFHYYEYKFGVNYKIHPQVKLTFGLGSYQTYKEGGNFRLPKNNNEVRLWPQLLFTHSVGVFKIEQRYRTEFRFTSNGYRNRFRYRFGCSYSFGGIEKEYKPFQVSVSNELFFTDKEPYFERNRFITAFNYKSSQKVTLQIGYLHQFDYKINDESGRDFLMLGYFVELFTNSNSSKLSDTDIKDN
jgi:hypothetical protein